VLAKSVRTELKMVFQAKEGATIWSAHSGYRTTPLPRQSLEAASARAATSTQVSEPLSEPHPRYTDSGMEDYSEDRNYAANLGSPIDCCSIFEDPFVAPAPRTHKATRKIRVLTLEPTRAMVDDPSGNFLLLLSRGKGGSSFRIGH